MTKKYYYAELDDALFRGEYDDFFNEVLHPDGWKNNADSSRINSYGHIISEEKAKDYAKADGLGLDGKKL